MELQLKISKETTENKNSILFFDKAESINKVAFNESELIYLNKKIEDKEECILLNSYSHIKIVVFAPFENKKNENETLELFRNKGNEAYEILQKFKLEEIEIQTFGISSDILFAFAEGIVYSTYRFLNYFSDKKGKENYLNSISFYNTEIEALKLDELSNNFKANSICKDLVNEPVYYLNTQKFTERIQEAGKEFGFSVEILNKAKIEALKMGGLLGVNKGSIDPPAFAIMEWKPKEFKNEKPIVLVGKGIVYDTGGLNLKPGNYMDDMKSDMAGGATVVGSFISIAANKLPLHIIGLIPITDNRPNGNAYASGDILKMHNGMTVEVLNTDAEGRLALADALSYAQKYDPQLVIDFATLTGAAAVALGEQAAVMMGNADISVKAKLLAAGNSSYERLVEFPFYDEYKKMLESNIADIKNIGGRDAGAITAGKFLEYFTNYPYIHIDIAGTAFLTAANKYRPKGGSGFGIRMLYTFLKHIDK